MQAKLVWFVVKRRAGQVYTSYWIAPSLVPRVPVELSLPADGHVGIY